MLYHFGGLSNIQIVQYFTKQYVFHHILIQKINEESSTLDKLIISDIHTGKDMLRIIDWVSVYIHVYMCLWLKAVMAHLQIISLTPVATILYHLCPLLF